MARKKVGRTCCRLHDAERQCKRPSFVMVLSQPNLEFSVLIFGSTNLKAERTSDEWWSAWDASCITMHNSYGPCRFMRFLPASATLDVTKASLWALWHFCTRLPVENCTLHSEGREICANICWLCLSVYFLSIIFYLFIYPFIHSGQVVRGNWEHHRFSSLCRQNKKLFPSSRPVGPQGKRHVQTPFHRYYCEFASRSKC